MKNTILWAATLLLASCAASASSLKVEVTNATSAERDDETVEIAWSEVAALEGATPENIVVLNDDGGQIPSQVIYLGQAEPQALIFQTDADAKETKRFRIATGVRRNYRTEAFGRKVPEHCDDYAGENNKAAYRLGVTLGAGASQPFVDGKFRMMDHNYATAETLDNGPIRTTVKLTYAPFDVAGTSVSLTKIISLDANRHFNRIDDIYEGAFTEMPIAAGFVRHDVKQILTGEGWMGMCEAASDSKQPERNGDIYLGVILPGAEMLTDTLGHAIAVKRVEPGQRLTYYAGSGWSQGGVDDMEEWIEQIAAARAAAVMPLRVTVK